MYHTKTQTPASDLHHVTNDNKEVLKITFCHVRDGH